MNLSSEPVTLSAALTAALVTTINVLGILFDWDADVIAGLNLAVGAWVIAISIVVRSRVTPNQEVALTHDDVYLIKAGQDLHGETPDGPAV